MKLKDFKALVQDAQQVTITHYPINSTQPVTSRRTVTDVTARGVHTLLSWAPHPPSFVDWPSGRGIGHRIEGRTLTWTGKNGKPLFSYHFPLSLEEALAEI
ncbi:hypothetical protein ABZX93_06045 [Streptomyces sp. NPDC006632]|uniref:hypothetical protein n=1 Tax=Streptomyces sp. NPDC006632 TaxID=3157182 RepID=UPI0033A3AE4F